MRTYYILKETAALFHSGGARITTNPVIQLKNKEEEERINKILLPAVFKEIDKLLSPKKIKGGLI